MLKKIAIFTAIAVLPLTSPVRGEVKINFKIGYVDIQKALNTCEAGKHAAAELNKEMEKAKAKYAAQAEELKREKDTLERQGPLLEESVLQEKMRDFRAKYRDWERFRKDAENDIKQRHNEMVDKISKELIEITNEIGKEGGYTLILERSLVPYIDPALDVTDKVIKLHNEKYGPKKGETPHLK